MTNFIEGCLRNQYTDDINDFFLPIQRAFSSMQMESEVSLVLNLSLLYGLVSDLVPFNLEV